MINKDNDAQIRASLGKWIKASSMAVLTSIIGRVNEVLIVVIRSPPECDF